MCVDGHESHLPPLLRGLVVLDNHWLLLLLVILLELHELVPLDLQRFPRVPHELALAIERLQLAMGPSHFDISNLQKLSEAIEEAHNISVEPDPDSPRYVL